MRSSQEFLIDGLVHTFRNVRCSKLNVKMLLVFYFEARPFIKTYTIDTRGIYSRNDDMQEIITLINKVKYNILDVYSIISKQYVTHDDTKYKIIQLDILASCSVLIYQICQLHLKCCVLITFLNWYNKFQC